MNDRHCNRQRDLAEKHRDLAEETLTRVETERLEAIRERDEARELLRRGAVAHNHASREEWLREVAAFLKRGEEGEVELTLEREIATQTEVIVCRLTAYEGMRRLVRGEMEAQLRRKLQQFGDEILAVWERMADQ